MTNVLKNYEAELKATLTATPQTVATPGRTDEVKNAAGGYVFAVSDRERLERFLILGTDGGTYYVGEQDLTKQNTDFVKGLIRSDERAVIDTLVNIADENRAAKNTPSIYTLALVLVLGKDKAYLRETDAVNKVVRTGTHLFEFANFIDTLGGWGRAKRNAVAEWYTGKTADQLAYQAVKYRQREGWTHRDLFRKVHPVGVDKGVGNFILGKDQRAGEIFVADNIIDGFTKVQKAGTAKEVLAVLADYPTLPWETIPTQFLKDEKVWKALFYNGAIGQTALLRNVTRFAKIGAFSDLVFAGDVAKALADEAKIIKGRMHPVAYANALGVYTKGQFDRKAYFYDTSYRAPMTWTTNPKIVGALEAGFYNAFKTVEPANKATLVAVDVSGSMTWAAPAGLVGMDYMEAAAIMAMVTVRTEPYVLVTAFSTTLTEVNISDADSIETVLKKFHNIRMGGTDIARPMIYAKAKNLGIDTFAIYSDMETWAGDQKPFQALKAYRQSSGRNARLAVVGLAGTSSTVADPTDKVGSLNIVGFDSAAPKVIADFSAGRV